ncbi:hypothetical protein NDU88_009877 [Pleurodeles waltl]|uniref:Uncharacterized protein n=1 Tax=Pleurodeles waltl TaxID=8319 RepID=A0AAV7QYS5_PLEWA|nr:hypothetical protein NDU88_009877 [Pleurodeles waltl]
MVIEPHDFPSFQNCLIGEETGHGAIQLHMTEWKPTNSKVLDIFRWHTLLGPDRCVFPVDALRVLNLDGRAA